MYHVKEKVTAQTEVKKSKFICILQPVSDEVLLREAINQIKKEYPAATHYCYGAIINGNNRSNDDGEPSSTAGKPILQQLVTNDLDNVLAVVVRYFGGTLLGTAGLVKAYGQTTKLAVEQAVLTLPVTVHNYELETDYAYISKIEYLLQNKALITQRNYHEKAVYRYQCQQDLAEEIQEITNGESQPVYLNSEIIEKEKQ